MPAAWNESIVVNLLFVLFNVAIGVVFWWLLTDKEINTFEDEDDE